MYVVLYFIFWGLDKKLDVACSNASLRVQYKRQAKPTVDHTLQLDSLLRPRLSNLAVSLFPRADITRKAWKELVVVVVRVASGGENLGLLDKEERRGANIKATQASYGIIAAIVCSTMCMYYTVCTCIGLEYERLFYNSR